MKPTENMLFAIDFAKKVLERAGWEITSEVVGGIDDCNRALHFRPKTEKIPEPQAPQKRKFVEPTEIPDGEAD